MSAFAPAPPHFGMFCRDLDRKTQSYRVATGPARPNG